MRGMGVRCGVGEPRMRYLRLLAGAQSLDWDVTAVTISHPIEKSSSTVERTFVFF